LRFGKVKGPTSSYAKRRFLTVTFENEWLPQKSKVLPIGKAPNKINTLFYLSQLLARKRLLCKGSFRKEDPRKEWVTAFTFYQSAPLEKIKRIRIKNTAKAHMLPKPPNPVPII
jgi:hypothetical protein